MISESVKTLDVYFETDLVGRVYDTNPLSFEYAPEWLAQKAIQIANIVMASGRTDADSVTAFFENLLPEGALRSYLFAARKASTLFGLLHSVAGDTAGGFILLPAGHQPQPQSYQLTSWQELATELKSKAAVAINLKSKGTRISLAGAQDKISLALFADGIPGLKNHRGRKGPASLALCGWRKSSTRPAKGRVLTAISPPSANALRPKHPVKRGLAGADYFGHGAHGHAAVNQFFGLIQLFFRE